MKKAMIALSAILVAAPVFAATTHATDDTVAAAHDAAEGKSDSVGSEVSEGAQKTWNKTKEGTEKGWNATKEGTEKGWNKTKEVSKEGWDKTKQGAEELKTKVTE